MRSHVGPLAPLVLAACLVGTLAACSGGGSGDDATTASSDTALASSSVPAGSSGSSGSPAGVPVGPGPDQPARGTVEVVRTLPHDPTLFTQGLQVVGDRVYESTGMLGRSQVQHRPLEGDGPVVSVPMARDEFGEGLAVTGDTVWTLTWQNGVAHNRDPETLEVRSEVRYQGEGWGLCTDGTRLVMSDGSDRLTTIYDASALEQPRPSNPDAVLNGIAALPGSENVLVTGKLWNQMYEVRLVG